MIKVETGIMEIFLMIKPTTAKIIGFAYIVAWFIDTVKELITRQLVMNVIEIYSTSDHNLKLLRKQIRANGMNSRNFIKINYGRIRN